MALTITEKATGELITATEANEMLKGTPEWLTDRTYRINNITSHLGIHYKSLANSNQGNTPASSPASWETTAGGITSIDFTIEGVSVVGEDQVSIMIPSALTISDVFIKVDTAPTGASLIVDVNINGTTIFTTGPGTERPVIAISGTSDTSGTPDTTALAQNDILSVSVDQIGSTISGGDNLYIRVNLA